jgi:hypothetical protein
MKIIPEKRRAFIFTFLSEDVDLWNVYFFNYMI